MLFKYYGQLYIYYRTLLNIDHTLLNVWPIVERLNKLSKPNNWLIESKWNKVYYMHYLCAHKAQNIFKYLRLQFWKSANEVIAWDTQGKF